MNYRFKVWNKKVNLMCRVEYIHCDREGNAIVVFAIHKEIENIGDSELRKGGFELLPYTDLYDKYKKRICQGDILKCQDGTLVYVDFHEGSFIVKYCNKKDYQYQDCSFVDNGLLINVIDYFVDLHSPEIIGNIYENNELLTG